MKSQDEKKLRNQLVSHLKGGQAFTPVDRLIKNITFDCIGIVPDELPYTFYQQFYHIWFTQADIINYCRNPDYQAPDWPGNYWPEQKAPETEQKWQELISAYSDEREEFCKFILDTSNNLFQPFSANEDHNLFREIQLVIEHTSYHTGQLFVIYRLLSRGS
ncbi:MAG: DinB family protein [Balneolaceae bacterium]